MFAFYPIKSFAWLYRIEHIDPWVGRSGQLMSLRKVGASCPRVATAAAEVFAKDEAVSDPVFLLIL